MKGIKLAAIVAVGVIALGGVWQYLTGREAVPEETDYVIDLEALRAAASLLPGRAPDHINHQVIAQASLPRAGVFAGESFDPHWMLHGVYQIMLPDGYVIVDAGFGPVLHEEQMGGEAARYDDDAFAIVLRALENAEAIVLTHEHLDHSEGLAHAGDFASLGPKVLMNRAQHENPETAEILPAALLAAIEPFDASGLHAIAPGVVLLPAAGHTPGSQIVYVRLTSGVEYLLIGDVAWHMDALRELHYRPRLVTDFFLGEDRSAVMAQFRALHDLLDTPGLHIVAAHDVEQRRALVKSGVLGDGLEAPLTPR